MDSIESNKLMQFPTKFRLRVFGLDVDDFAIFVMCIIRQHVPELNEDHIETRNSREGKYLAVRVSFVAKSREQLDAIYRDLNQQDRVLFVL